MACHNLSFLLVAVHQAAFSPVVLWVGLFEVGCRTFNAAAAAGGEHIEHLAAEVVCFDESVDDGWGGVPPHGEADPDGVVLGDVFTNSLDSGAGTLFFHLKGGAGGLVAPVEVGGGVGCFGCNFIDVGVEFAS